MFRAYIDQVRSRAEWDISEEMSQNVQDEFVQDRKSEGVSVGAMKNQQDLMLRLDLARWLSFSKGEPSLSPETWGRVRELERLRLLRLNSDQERAGQ
jgi:hypothetical protein